MADGFLKKKGLNVNTNVAGLAARDKVQRAQMDAIWNTLEALDQSQINQGVQAQKGKSRWEEPVKTTEVPNQATQPMNIENITFSTTTYNDPSPAEKDKFNRINEKNIELAKSITKSIKEIAFNTKQKYKQDTTIKKSIEKMAGGAEKSFQEKKQSAITKAEDNLGFFDKIFKWITDNWYKLMSTIYPLKLLFDAVIGAGSLALLVFTKPLKWGYKLLTSFKGAVGTVFKTLFSIPKKAGVLFSKFIGMFATAGKSLLAFFSLDAWKKSTKGIKEGIKDFLFGKKSTKVKITDSMIDPKGPLGCCKRIDAMTKAGKLKTLSTGRTGGLIAGMKDAYSKVPTFGKILGKMGIAGALLYGAIEAGKYLGVFPENIWNIIGDTLLVGGKAILEGLKWIGKMSIEGWKKISEWTLHISGEVWQGLKEMGTGFLDVLKKSETIKNVITFWEEYDLSGRLQSIFLSAGDFINNFFADPVGTIKETVSDFLSSTLKKVLKTGEFIKILGKKLFYNLGEQILKWGSGMKVWNPIRQVTDWLGAKLTGGVSREDFDKNIKQKMDNLKLFDEKKSKPLTKQQRKYQNTTKSNMRDEMNRLYFKISQGLGTNEDAVNLSILVDEYKRLFGAKYAPPALDSLKRNAIQAIKITDKKLGITEKGKLISEEFSEIGQGINKSITNFYEDRIEKSAKEIKKTSKENYNNISNELNLTIEKSVTEIKKTSKETIKKITKGLNENLSGAVQGISDVYDTAKIKALDSFETKFGPISSYKVNLGNTIGKFNLKKALEGISNFMQTNLSNINLQGGDKEFFKVIWTIETGGNNINDKFNARNRSTGAFGFFQFMPSTWNEQSKQIGINWPMTKTSKIPPAELQIKVYQEVYLKNSKKHIKSAGLPVNVWNLWLAHNLGAGSLKFMNGRTNTPHRGALRDINNQLPQRLKSNNVLTARNNYVSFYSNKIAKILGQNTNVNLSQMTTTQSPFSLNTLGSIGSKAVSTVSSASQNVSASIKKLVSEPGEMTPSTNGSLIFLNKEQEGVLPQVKTMLEQLSTKIGQPLKILSGYRNQAYNASINGAKNSYHTKRMAVDIQWPEMISKEQFLKMALQVGFKGIGIYPGFIHVDIGPVRAWGPCGSRSCLPQWAATIIGGTTKGIIPESFNIGYNPEQMFIPGVGMVANGGGAITNIQDQLSNMNSQILNLTGSINTIAKEQLDKSKTQLSGDIDISSCQI